MKSKTNVEKMYSFIGFFNDGQFMNQDYRKGIMDALSYVLYDGGRLKELKRRIENNININLEVQDGKDSC